MIARSSEDYPEMSFGRVFAGVSFGGIIGAGYGLKKAVNVANGLPNGASVVGVIAIANASFCGMAGAVVGAVIASAL